MTSGEGSGVYSKGEEEFNISLAKLVEKYPCIYDFTRKEYNNPQTRTAAWQAISEALDEGVEDCKLRWKSLRGCITRDKKYARQGKVNKKPYYLQEHLQFIKPFTRVAARTSRASVRLVSYPDTMDETLMNEVEQVVEQSSPAVEQQTVQVAINRQDCIELQELRTVEHAEDKKMMREAPPPQPAAEYITLTTEEQHPEMNFFRSLLPDINRMNPRQRSSFRLGVVSLVDQVLYGQAEQQYVEPQQASSTACSTVVWST